MTHSFPTRRASDLPAGGHAPNPDDPAAHAAARDRSRPRQDAGEAARRRHGPHRPCPPSPAARATVSARTRSEEHTSELQSLMRISYAVFCLKQQKLHTPHSIKYTYTIQTQP